MSTLEEGGSGGVVARCGFGPALAWARCNGVSRSPGSPHGDRLKLPASNFPVWLSQVASRSYYDGDGRLAVVQRYEQRGSGEASVAYGAWEESRYDALGRRVLTKVRRPNSGQPLAGTTALCTATAGDVCSSYTERVWWAGDAILRKARTADSPANPTNSGEVAYVHAPGVRGIDAPVAVRMGGVVRVVSADWRGLGETSLFPTGAPADNTISGGPAIKLAWPSGRGAYFTPYLNAAPGSWAAHTWAGSLVEHGAGASGLLYRRNRYYDPRERAVHAAGPDRARRGAERVRVRRRGSGVVFGSIWPLSGRC